MTLDDELATKRARVRAMLDAHELDGLLLATPASVSWITCGGDPVVDLTAAQGVAAVLCTRDGETLLTNTIEHARMLEEALPRPPAHVEVFGWHESSGPEAARRLRPGARLGCDLTLAGFEDCAIGVRALRLVLTPAEQERYRVLCRDAGTAIEETAEIVEPDMSALEITGALAAET
jgi:Xaa-Pro aminopeptidase